MYVSGDVDVYVVIFSRISRSKDGLTTDAEMSDAEAALKSVGVSVRGADGDLRDITLLKRQVKATEKQIVANEKASDAYMKKAESIGLSEEYKNKVINGTLTVEEIDTSSDSGKQLANCYRKCL